MTCPSRSVSVLQKIKHHTSDVTSCDFWSNSFLATGSGDKTVVVWEWKTGFGFTSTGYSPLLGHKYSITCVRFMPRGDRLVSSSADAYTLLWDVKTGDCLYSFVQCNGYGVRSCSVSKNSCLLSSAGEGGTLCLWDINNHSLLRTIEGHDEESIQGVSFSPDSFILVSGDVTGSFKVWDVASAKDGTEALLETVRDAHDLGINALDFSPNYTSVTDEEKLEEERTYVLVTCGNDHALCLWQISVCRPKKGSLTPAHALPVVPLGSLRQHTSAVSSVRFSNNGQLLVSTSIDKTARIWDVPSSKCIRTLEGHSRYIACCAFSYNQNLLVTGSNDKSIWIWDLSGELDVDSELEASTSALYSQTSLNAQAPFLTESSNVKLLQSLEGHTGGVNTCHFSNSLLATAGADKVIRLWTWKTDENMTLYGELEGHGYAINQVEFCGDRLASCSLDGSTLLWNPSNGEVVASGFHLSGTGVKCVRFSPDCSLILAGGDDEKASLFETTSYQLVVEYGGQTDGLTAVAFTPDSSYLALGSADGHCRLYNTCSSIPVASVEDAHDLGLTSLDFSPIPHAQPSGSEGKYELATCGQDCLVKVWKIDSNEKSIGLLWRLAGHGGSVTCVRYSPQLGEMIASTATDKTCRLWDSYSGDCLHVLNHHSGILTCCAFSPDATLLATGSMDKTVQIWELPKDLAFQSFVASRISSKTPAEIKKWSVNDVNKWLEENNLPAGNLTGAALLHSSPSQLLDQLNIDDVSVRDELIGRLAALKGMETPHELICPITHQIMRDPVTCSDGYTYERSAIESWFGSGHFTSPMTNSMIFDTDLEPNLTLRSTISAYLSTLAKAS